MRTGIYFWRRLEILRHCGTAARGGGCPLSDNSRIDHANGGHDDQKAEHDCSNCSRECWMSCEQSFRWDSLCSQLFVRSRVAGFLGNLMQLEFLIGWCVELVVLVAHVGHDADSPSSFAFYRGARGEADRHEYTLCRCTRHPGLGRPGVAIFMTVDWYGIAFGSCTPLSTARAIASLQADNENERKSCAKLEQRGSASRYVPRGTLSVLTAASPVLE